MGKFPSVIFGRDHFCSQLFRAYFHFWSRSPRVEIGQHGHCDFHILSGNLGALGDFCEFLSASSFAFLPIDGVDFYGKRLFHDVKMDILHNEIAVSWRLETNFFEFSA